MDGSRFDRITRALATGATRRRAVHALTGGAVAGLFGLTSPEAAAAACIKPGKQGCEGPRNGRCCAGATCVGGTRRKAGRCQCRDSLTRCGAACVNTTTDKKHCGRCNRRCAGLNHCHNGECVNPFFCTAGPDYCFDHAITPCPAASGCFCTTDIEGQPHCTSGSNFTCTDCTSNAGCPSGRVCVFSGQFCPCNGGGNVCMPATCDLP